MKGIMTLTFRKWWLGVFAASIAVHGYAFASANFLLNQQQLEDLRDQVLPSQFRQRNLQELSAIIKEKSMTLADWQIHLANEKVEVLCLGESHEKNYRNAIGKVILPQLQFDTLSLEGTQAEVQFAVRNASLGESVKWVGADFNAIVEGARSQNPSVAFLGIEVTDEQKMASLKEKLSSPTYRVLNREGFIAHNFMNKYKSGRMNVILYGSNHCSYNDNALPLEVPMFRRLKRTMSAKVKSALVLPRSRRDHPVVAYFEALGLLENTFVLDNFSQISPELFNYRFDVMAFQQNFDTLIFVSDR